MAKPKVAFYWCASCGGCEETVVDLNEDILKVVDAVDIILWPVALDFKKKDIEFVSLTEGFDTSTAQGKLFFSIVGAFAEFERSLIQERINAGLKRAKKEGKKLGRPKGKKDGKIRRKSGYIARWANSK